MYPYTLGINLLCAGLFAGIGTSAITALIWFKNISTFIVVFHISSSRKRDFWLYYNLGLSKIRLWAAVLFLDYFLFIFLLIAGHQLCTN
jgi:hypothetical protein